MHPQCFAAWIGLAGLNEQRAGLSANRMQSIKVPPDPSRRSSGPIGVEWGVVCVAPAGVRVSVQSLFTRTDCFCSALVSDERDFGGFPC